MKIVMTGLVLLAFTAITVKPATGQVVLNFSTDLGSDLDRSDPNAQGNELMDCGDLYVENLPTRIKDDSASPYPTDGDADGDGPNLGYPYQSALQPSPGMIGAGSGGAGSVEVEGEYQNYFDLDADDQLDWSIYESYQHHSDKVVVVPKGTPGVNYEPNGILISFEDDGAPGWYNTPDVPTMVPQDNATEVYGDQGAFWSGPGGSWSPASLASVRDEVALGLGPNPPDTVNDDDVDALDCGEHRSWYWSADHEANMGDDPGSIYETDKLAGAVNKTLVIDDSTAALATGLWLGVNKDTDIDAWEFVAIGYNTYSDIFGKPPVGASATDWILCGLFSPDADDIDTAGVSDLYGNESGGLLDNSIYISDLLGTYVLMATYDGGVDALTTCVPEPNMGIMLIGTGLGLLAVFAARRRK